MNKRTKIKLWIYGFTLLLIGIGIYSGFQPRNPNKVLKSQMKFFGLDYNLLKPDVTFFRDDGYVNDLYTKILFNYEASNDQLHVIFSKMKNVEEKGL